MNQLTAPLPQISDEQYETGKKQMAYAELIYKACLKASEIGMSMVQVGEANGVSYQYVRMLHRVYTLYITSSLYRQVFDGRVAQFRDLYNTAYSLKAGSTKTQAEARLRETLRARYPGVDIENLLKAQRRDTQGSAPKQ